MYNGLKMATLTIKNIPDSLLKSLKQRASLNKRSLNDEIISCLERALIPGKISVDDFLVEVRKNRVKLKVNLSDDILTESKSQRR